MAEYVKLDGLADAKAAIESLTKEMRKKVVLRALKVAAKPMVSAAKANAPFKTGLVRNRIRVFVSKLKRGPKGEIGVYIKPRISAGARKSKDRSQDPFYYRFQEAGYHATGRKKVGGGRRLRSARLVAMVRSGAIRAIPGKAFLGRAFESHRSAALTAFTAEIKKYIDLINARKS